MAISIKEHKRRYYLRHRDKVLARNKSYAERNKEKMRERCRQYYLRNKERILARVTAYEKENTNSCNLRKTEWAKANRAKVKTARAKWFQKNPKYRLKWALSRLHSDATYRLTAALRGRLYSILKRKRRSKSALVLLGCSLEDFWIYLESKFESGMTRENYGKVWHVDHIIPCALFDMSKHDHQKRCFHFSNMQPLFASCNLKKGSRSDGQLRLM